jgi:hypothetical protein
MLALLGGLGSVVVAQMDEDADAVYITRISEEPGEGRDSSVVESETLYSSRDGVVTGTAEWSDPRASGTFTSTFNVDVDPDTGHGIMWSWIRVENDGGTWEGPLSGMEYEPPEGDFYTMDGWLIGDGGYAGYTLYVQVDAFQGGGPVRTAHGVIFKGQPPTAEPPAD